MKIVLDQRDHQSSQSFGRFRNNFAILGLSGEQRPLFCLGVEQGAPTGFILLDEEAIVRQCRALIHVRD